jgi:hypothetical protein
LAGREWEIKLQNKKLIKIEKVAADARSGHYL